MRVRARIRPAPRSHARRLACPKERTTMDVFDGSALEAIGLTPDLAERAAALAAGWPGAALARVTEVHRESVVLDDSASTRTARPHPKLLRELDAQDGALAVGDFAFDRDDAGERWVVARVPPRSAIVRRDGYGVRHAVVNNVDVALVVMGLDDDFNPRRLERFLALVHDDAIEAVVVLTKVDIARAAGDDLDARVDELRARIGGGCPIRALDATARASAGLLAPWCGRGRTLVLLGSSGAGKSTLTNTLLGADVQDTGEVRIDDGRGKHTTTARTLFRLPGGACVIDTPGVRTLGIDDGAGLAATFVDIEALAAGCRFADCRHDTEPGCAVRDAVDADRLANWRKLGREHARLTATALERRKRVGEWKARGREAEARARMKRGG